MKLNQAPGRILGLLLLASAAAAAFQADVPAPPAEPPGRSALEAGVLL